MVSSRPMSKVRVLLVWLLAFGASPLLFADDFFFDSAGVKIHYTVEGKGEPVISQPLFISSLKSFLATHPAGQ